MSAELRRATAAQLRAGFGSGAFTALEVVDALLGAIAQEDAALGAWLHLRTDEVRGEAQRADDRTRCAHLHHFLASPLH
jgi:Asp-tRNA(Asn)/Glu-tRNA(Gln) amidotransferase A subunit family amidase